MFTMDVLSACRHVHHVHAVPKVTKEGAISSGIGFSVVSGQVGAGDPEQVGQLKYLHVYSL